MKASSVRYRTESFGGSGVRDAAEVIRFEVFELGNSDIIEYLSDNVLPEGKMREQALSFVRELDDNGYVDDMPENVQLAFAHEMLQEVYKATGVECKYAIWLGSKETAWQYWRACENVSVMEETPNACDVPADFLLQSDIERYDTTNGIVLSDLGCEGALYGFDHDPMPEERKECFA